MTQKQRYSGTPDAKPSFYEMELDKTLRERPTSGLVNEIGEHPTDYYDLDGYDDPSFTDYAGEF